MKTFFKFADSISIFQERKGLKQILFAGFILFVFILLLYMNIKTPMLGDDYTYSLIFNTAQKLQSVSDIVSSQITHYNIWGGRIIVHSISQLLLFINPLSADIINSLAFVGLILLLYLHINYKKPLSLSLLIGVFLLVWMLEPFAETILWITGSANYMWGTTIVLSFLLPYRIYEAKKKHRGFVATLQAIAMLLFGMVAGWTNENTAAGMIVMCILFLVYHKWEKRQLPLWAYAGLPGAIIGYILMIAAPGNAVRAQGGEMEIMTIMYNVLSHTNVFLQKLGLFNAIIVPFAVYIYRKDVVKFKLVLSLLAIYAGGIFVAVYAMSLAPFFPDRAWFGAIVFNIIALGILAVNIETPFVRCVKYGFVALGLMAFLFNSYFVYKDVNHVEQQLIERNRLITAGIEAKKDTITIHPYATRTKYALQDADYSAQLLSRYYGVEIRFE
jgi:hypothetical protein